MGPGSDHHTAPSRESIVRTDDTLHGHNDRAIANAAGTLSIDGFDVSAFDRVPCFAMAGQDSDLFRGESHSICRFEH